MLGDQHHIGCLIVQPSGFEHVAVWRYDSWPMIWVWGVLRRRKLVEDVDATSDDCEQMATNQDVAAIISKGGVSLE